MPVADKKRALEGIITECGSMLVSFSGGVDSTLLAVLAHDLLGDRSRAVFLDSPLVPRAAVADAKKIAEDLGIRSISSKSRTWSMKISVKIRRNVAITARKSLQCILKETAEKYGLSCIADGINVSDMGEHRPGLTAATEEGIIHPFILAGITKEEIRQIARDYGLAGLE